MAYNIGIANKGRPGIREVIATAATLDAIEAEIAAWASANNWEVADFDLDTDEGGADAFLISKISRATMILTADAA